MKQAKLTLGLSAVLGLALLAAPGFAATTATRTINYQMIINPTLTATCPGSTVDLGTYDFGDSPSATSVSCTVTQNRASGTLSITASPAANSINLTESGSGDTYAVNFSNYAFSSGTLGGGGTFAAGLSVTNPSRGASTFSFDATPAASIPSTNASGTYTGSNSLTFSLI